MFPLFATGVIYTGGKFAAGVVDTGGNMPPASLTLVKKLTVATVDTSGKFTTVLTTLAKLVEKFAAGVIDTSGAPLLANISANFRKKF